MEIFLKMSCKLKFQSDGYFQNIYDINYYRLEKANNLRYWYWCHIGYCVNKKIKTHHFDLAK